MLPRPLLALVRAALHGTGGMAGRPKAATARCWLRSGLRQAQREVGWEPVLLLVGVAAVWWALRAWIDPGATLDAAAEFPALDQGGWSRGAGIALSGLLGLAAMYTGLTLGVLEFLVGLEVSRAAASPLKPES